MAERSKATDSSSVLFGGVSSNLTESIILHLLDFWTYSSVVEHGIADPMVTGSIPVMSLLSILRTYFSKQKNRANWRSGSALGS